MRSPQAAYLATMLLLQIILSTHSTLHHGIFEVIDFSNVDLRNFKYFKNLPSQNPQARQVNPLLEHFLKKKAILNYFENLFFGNSPFTQESEIPFDPHFGRAWRPYFERKYGRRGKFLIENLGKGHDLKKLKNYGAIPKEFGTIYYPS